MIAVEHLCAYCGRPAFLTVQRRRPGLLRWLFHGPYPRRWVCGAGPCVESGVEGK